MQDIAWKKIHTPSKPLSFHTVFMTVASTLFSPTVCSCFHIHILFLLKKKNLCFWQSKMKHTVFQNHVRKVNRKHNIAAKLTDLPFWLLFSLKRGFYVYWGGLCIFCCPIRDWKYTVHWREEMDTTEENSATQCWIPGRHISPGTSLTSTCMHALIILWHFSHLPLQSLEPLTTLALHTPFNRC